MQLLESNKVDGLISLHSAIAVQLRILRNYDLGLRSYGEACAAQLEYNKLMIELKNTAF